MEGECQAGCAGRLAESQHGGIAEAAQSLTGGDSSRGVLARVMQQQDRDVELPLQLNPSPLPTPLLTSYVAGMTSGATE
jgi:hypothetical protein